MPLRSISPLATGLATAVSDGNVLFRSVLPLPNFIGSGNSGSGINNLSISPSASSFNLSANFTLPIGDNSSLTLVNSPNVVKNLTNFNIASTSSSSAITQNSSNTAAGSGSQSAMLATRSHRNSFMITTSGETLTATEQTLLRLISDGATRFLHHQLCEICADCLQKSRDDVLMCSYFCNMSVRLDETLAEVNYIK